MTARRLWLALAGLVVSALGLVAAFGRVHLHPLSLEARLHWPELRAVLAAARWPWLVVYAALNASTMLTRALQLQALARRRDGRRPGFGPAWRAVTLGMLAQTILPARLGEAARGFAIIKDGDVPAPYAVGALALGRVLDLVALLCVSCAPPLLLGLQAATAGPVRTAARIGSLVALLLLVGLGYFYRRRRAAALAAQSLRPWLGRFVGGLAEGLSALGSPSRLVEAALSSLAIPATVAACYACAAHAFGITLPPGGALLMVAAVFLAIAVPSAPSAVGVYHAVASWVLIGYGAPLPAATAFVISTHVIGVVEFILLGGVSFMQMGGRVRLGAPD